MKTTGWTRSWGFVAEPQLRAQPLLLAFATLILVTASRASASLHCPRTCSDGCGPAKHGADFADGLATWLRDVTFGGVVPVQFPSLRTPDSAMEPSCGINDRLRAVDGIDMKAVSFLVAALSRCAVAAPNAAGISAWMLQVDTAPFNGMPLRANGDAWLYGDVTLAAQGIAGYTFNSVATCSACEDPVDPQNIEAYPVGQPTLLASVYEIIGLLFSDTDNAANATNISASAALKRFRGLVKALGHMAVSGSFYLEVPAPQPMRQDGNETPAPFHPAPPFQSVSQTLTPPMPEPTSTPPPKPSPPPHTGTPQPSLHPAPAFTTPSLSATLVATPTITPTRAPQTTEAPTTTTAPPTTSEEPPTTAPHTTTTTPPTPPPATHVPPTYAPETPAPETPAPPPSPAPSPSPPPPPPPPSPGIAPNDIMIASQAALLAAVNLLNDAVGSDPAVDQAVGTVRAVVHQGFTKHACPLTIDNNKGFYTPAVLGVTSGIPHVKSNAFVAEPQLVIAAALGTQLDALCGHPKFALKLMNYTFQATAMRDPHGAIVALSSAGAGVVDEQLTNIGLMAALRLATEYGGQVAAAINNLVAGIAPSSALAHDVCWRGNFSSASVFSQNAPTPVCGGPAPDVGLTSLRHLVILGLNFFKPAFGPPVGPTPSPPPAAPAGNGVPLMPVVVGGVVGGLVVIATSAVVVRRLRRPKRDVLLAPPTQNLGFF